MAEDVKTLNECIDKLVAELYTLQRKHNPELLVEYFTLTTSIVNLVQFTERANTAIVTKKPADAQITDAINSLNVCIKTLETLLVPTGFYKERYAKLESKSKQIKVGSAEKCYECGQRSIQYEQEVELARVHGMAEPPPPNLAEVYGLLREDLYSTMHKLAAYVSRGKPYECSREDDIIQVKTKSINKSVDISDYMSVIELLHMLMDEVRNMDREHIFEYIANTSMNNRAATERLEYEVSLHPNMYNKRHEIKMKIISALDTAQLPLGETIREQEIQMEKFAESLNDVIQNINTLISPEVKSTCINHCYEIIDIVTIPVELQSKKLTQLIEKKYKINVPKNDAERDQFISMYL